MSFELVIIESDYSSRINPWFGLIHLKNPLIQKDTFLKKKKEDAGKQKQKLLINKKEKRKKARN